MTTTESRDEVVVQSAPGWTWTLLIAISLLLTITGGISSCNKRAEAEKTAAIEQARKKAASAPANTIVVEFPISGEGHATKEVGLKAWLDPMKTYVRASKPARYVFVEDTDLFFDNTESAEEETTEQRKKWLNMPAGKYLVYPLKGDKIYFRWWQ